MDCARNARWERQGRRLLGRRDSSEELYNDSQRAIAPCDGTPFLQASAALTRSLVDDASRVSPSTNRAIDESCVAGRLAPQCRVFSVNFNFDTTADGEIRSAICAEGICPFA